MVSGTLYTYPENFRAYKILIAANYCGAKVRVSQDFVFGKTNKTKEFLGKFPLGKVPAFETDDGKLFLTESNAIAFHVSNQKLKGIDPVIKASVLQWMNFADSEILPASCAWVFPVLGILPPDNQAIERAKEDIKAVLSMLNTHLITKTYLATERITLADICVACNLLHLYQHVLDPKFRKPYQNVDRWFTTIINQPQVKSVIGDIKLCEKPALIDPKKYAEMREVMGDTAKKQGNAEKKHEDKDAEVMLESEPKGSKDPFEKYPKGNFDMDDFKRFYSNEDVDKSVPYFWEKFDPEHYSIWFAEYKYPEELQKVFMSCNLITGMYQRLDKMRKNAFGSVCLFGTDNDSTISGVWVWRGKKLAFELSPDWQVDYESYDWKQLDPKDPKTKELVNQYLSWVGTDKNGRKFNQGKIFK